MSSPPTLPTLNAAGNVAYVHKLKCWAENFDAILSGTKRAEVREETDRKFKAGDLLELTRTDRAGVVAAPAVRILIEITHVERHAGPLELVAVKDDDGIESTRNVPIAVLSLAQRFYKVTE